MLRQIYRQVYLSQVLCYAIDLLTKFYLKLGNPNKYSLIGFLYLHNVSGNCMAGFSNLRPTGHMRPARQYFAAREVIYILKVLDELIKK